MKTKHYRSGKYTFRSYLKTVGEGFEVGFYCGHDPIFVGNFIHSTEANQWYGIMNRQIRQFSKKYTVGPKFPISWFTNFCKNHLYKCYYTFVDRLLARHNRMFETKCRKNVRQYNRMKRNWTERRPFLKVA